MAFIGKKPTAAPLTSSDVADGIITNAKLAQDIISADTALAVAPADTDEFLVSDAGVLKRMDYSYIKTASAVVDLWRLSASATGLQDPISSNWERADTDGAGVIGSGMTESSGVFTFPSTGYWRIDFLAYMYLDGDNRGITCDMQTTTDGSTFDRASSAGVFIQQTGGSNTYSNGYCTFIMDVTSTSTHKVQFVAGADDVRVYGATGDNATTVVFTRLGDT